MTIDPRRVSPRSGEHMSAREYLLLDKESGYPAGTA
jgi:hypothetical protein